MAAFLKRESGDDILENRYKSGILEYMENEVYSWMHFRTEMTFLHRGGGGILVHGDRDGIPPCEDWGGILTRCDGGCIFKRKRGEDIPENRFRGGILINTWEIKWYKSVIICGWIWDS
jgi:hypothetical protein